MEEGKLLKILRKVQKKVVHRLEPTNPFIGEIKLNLPLELTRKDIYEITEQVRGMGYTTQFGFETSLGARESRDKLYLIIGRKKT